MEPQHMTIGLFEANESTRQVMEKKLIEFLSQYDLRKKIIEYVKDEGANLNAMTIALKFVVNYEVFGLEENFEGTCFGHAFSKPYQYGIAKKKVCKNLKHISIKSTQFNLQKCITWPKKSRKGRHECTKTCINYRIRLKKQNTPIKTRYFLRSLLFKV
jgi:hypothetical protein